MGCVEVTLDRWIIERITAFERVFCRGNPFAVCVGYSVRWNEELRAEVRAVILYFEDDEPKLESLDVEEILGSGTGTPSYSMEMNLDPKPRVINRENFINPGIHIIKNEEER